MIYLRKRERFIDIFEKKGAIHWSIREKGSDSLIFLRKRERFIDLFEKNEAINWSIRQKGSYSLIYSRTKGAMFKWRVLRKTIQINRYEYRLIKRYITRISLEEDDLFGVLQGVLNGREIQLTRPALPCFADGTQFDIRNIQNRLLYTRYLYIRQIFLIQME